MRYDDSYDTFSYNKCITGKNCSVLQLTKNAMRYSIIPQILKFKHNTISVCNICKIYTNEVEIDHDTPIFSELTNMFLALHFLNVPTKFTVICTYP